MHFERTFDDVVISTNQDLLDRNLTFSWITNSYWATGIPRPLFDKSLKNAICFGMYKNNQQIGFARVTSDLATFAYLGDVFVAEGERGRGYAHALMETVMSHPDLQGLRRFCLGTTGAHELYKRYGFEVVRKPENWMEIKKENIYLNPNQQTKET